MACVGLRDAPSGIPRFRVLYGVRTIASLTLRRGHLKISGGLRALLLYL